MHNNYNNNYLITNKTLCIKIMIKTTQQPINILYNNYDKNYLTTCKHFATEV